MGWGNELLVGRANTTSQCVAESLRAHPITAHHPTTTVTTQQVGQMSRRPTASDLELAFINAKAAQSPLTSLVKGVKGLFDKAAQQQQKE